MTRSLDVRGQSFGRDHQDGQVLICLPEQFREFETVHLRHHDVDDSEVDLFTVHAFERFDPVRGGHDLVAFRGEDLGEEFPGVAVVIDD